MTEKPDRQQKPSPGGSKADWKNLHLWQIQWVRDVLVFLAVFGLLWVGQKISVVTVPLLLAVLLAYLFEPVIRGVMRRAKWDRGKAVTAVLAAVILVVVVPSGLGLTVGAAQSIAFLRSLSDNITKTYEAVQAGRALDTAVAEWDPELAGRALDRRDLTRLERLLSEAAKDAGEGEESDAGAVDGEGPGGASEPGESPPDEGEQPETATPDGGADGGADGREGSGSEQPAMPSVEERPEIPESIGMLFREYQAALAKTGEPDRVWRIVAEFIHDAGANNTLDEVFMTVQRWIRANAEELASAGAGTLATTLGLVGSAFGLVFMLFLTAFFFYFIATGWVGVQRFGASLIPDRHRELSLDMLTKFDAVISAFIRGRLTIAFIQSILFTVGYLLIGVPAAFLLGPIVAALSIVPYLALVGVPISVGLLATAGYDDFRGEWWWYLGAPTAIYLLGQAVDDYILTPKIQGKSTDMSTPMILFASLAGGVLFGVFGLLIAIPLAACLKILTQEIFWPRFKGWAEGREKDFLPIDSE